ncbi:MAG: LuxR family transcriptional regulator [Pseudomonadota bacterium]
MIDWQATQVEGLGQAHTEADLYKVLARAASDLGFDYFAYGMRMPLPLSNPKLFLLNNYPAEWQQRYAQENYLAVDPTVAHGMRSVAPVVWSQPTNADSQTFWDDARGHGLKVGWAQSSFNAQGSVGMLTLARSGDELSQAELRENSMCMSWLVHAAHEAVTRIVSTPDDPERRVALTAREIEVLRWTADGKTSGEVGQIMDISERTVNFHINNSLEKLNANNKTAGVIKAAMRRLL